MCAWGCGWAWVSLCAEFPGQERLCCATCLPLPPPHTLNSLAPLSPGPGFCPPAPLEGLLPTSRTRREARSNSSYTGISPGLDPTEISLCRGWEATHDRHNHTRQEGPQPRQALSLGENKPVRLLPSQEAKEKSLARREDRSYRTPLPPPPTPPCHSGSGPENPPSQSCVPAHTL